jgi:uncharacterized protein YjiS (DUF1127 family)
MSGSAIMQRSFLIGTASGGRGAGRAVADRLLRLLSATVRALTRGRNQTIAIARLGALNDALLKDIGLTRGDIHLAAHGTPLDDIRRRHLLD